MWPASPAGSSVSTSGLAASAAALDLAGAVAALPELGDPAAVAVVAGGRAMLRQRHRERQPDIAEPDHRNPLVAHHSLPVRMNTPSICNCRASLRSK